MPRPAPPARPTTPVSKGLGDPLPDDAQCPHCKYSLKGLRSGGRCPECGTPIAFRARRHRFEDNLTDAPPHYLKTLAVGCWLMFAGAFLTGGLLMSVRLAGSANLAPAIAGAAGVTGVLWWVGVWIVTQPRQSPGASRSELEREWLRCRWFSRISQAGWALAGVSTCGYILSVRAAMAAALAAILPYAPTQSVKTFEALASLGSFAGLIGLLPLCIVVASLADWASNTGLADRLRTSAWLVTLGTVGIALALPAVLAKKSSLFGPVALMVYGTTFLGFLGFIAGMGLLLLSLAQLAGMSLWAIHNAVTRSESDRRIAERAQQHSEELAARSARVGVTSIPAPVNPVQGAGTRDKPGKNDRPIYALEPEEPERS